MSSFEGRRRDDTRIGDLPDDLQHGDYWRLTNSEGEPLTTDEPSNLTGAVWMVWFDQGAGTLSKHTVREEDDGTASIRPGDGSSNSVLIKGHRGEFHGYLERGVWSEV